MRKYNLRKFRCPKGHWFLAPIWVSYLTCPAFCSEDADRVEDLIVKGIFERQQDYGFSGEERKKKKKLK